MMRICHTLALGVVAFAFSTASSYGGPCSQAIDRAQIQVDAKIAATAKAGKSAPESRAARLHHQPTPASIAAAEAKLNEGSGGEAALAALARAREVDRANDARACNRALAEVRRAIGR
jgi:hypothetical protein